jgi:hypothetical protein
MDSPAIDSVGFVYLTNPKLHFIENILDLHPGWGHWLTLLQGQFPQQPYTVPFGALIARDAFYSIHNDGNTYPI